MDNDGMKRCMKIAIGVCIFASAFFLAYAIVGTWLGSSSLMLEAAMGITASILAVLVAYIEYRNITDKEIRGTARIWLHNKAETGLQLEIIATLLNPTNNPNSLKCVKFRLSDGSCVSTLDSASIAVVDEVGNIINTFGAPINPRSGIKVRMHIKGEEAEKFSKQGVIECSAVDIFAHEYAIALERDPSTASSGLTLDLRDPNQKCVIPVKIVLLKNMAPKHRIRGRSARLIQVGLWSNEKRQR